MKSRTDPVIASKALALAERSAENSKKALALYEKNIHFNEEISASMAEKYAREIEISEVWDYILVAVRKAVNNGL